MTVDEKINAALQIVASEINIPHTIKDNRILIPLGHKDIYIRCAFTQYRKYRKKMYAEDTDRVEINIHLMSDVGHIFANDVSFRPIKNDIDLQLVKRKLTQLYEAVKATCDLDAQLERMRTEELGNIPDSLHVEKKESGMYYVRIRPLLSKDKVMAIIRVMTE